MLKSLSFRVLSLIFAVSIHQNVVAQCPITNSCTPGNATNVQAPLFGGGIYEVSLGTFFHASAGATEGYVDNCPLGVTNITIGQPISIVVKTGNLVSENVRVYIDLDNDLTFNPTTELVFSSNNAKNHTGSINISTANLNETVKMRVTADLITAAIPGPCSTPEYSQVEDYAVKIIANIVPPVAQFSVSDTLTCNGTISFTDQSINNPTTWLWNFGDNQTSNLQNPSHTYTNPGQYTVSLKVTSVNGADSITKLNLIRYNDTVPVAASCAPITQNQCCGYGITRFRLNTIDNFSTVGSYENFTCTRRTTILQGRSYTLSLTTNPNQTQDSKIWIDFNNNGIFETEELVWTSLNSISPSAPLIINSLPGMLLNIPLRLRVVSEYAGATFNSCSPLDKGQCEDYTVVIKENTEAPVAAFTVTSPNFCLPTFNFSSQSLNVISSYHWYFGDGNDSLTTNPNISYSYASPGSYTVKLVVVGPFGYDSLTIEDAVSFLGAPLAACDLISQIIPQPIQVGIARVQFGSIDKSSGNYNEGYQDFSCSNQATVFAGQSIQLRVKNSSQIAEKVRAWIDWDGNGTFADNELVLSTNGDTVHTAQVAIPETALMNQPLRMRIASNANQAGAIQSCGNLQAGQAEDYGVIVKPNTVPPVTLFTVDKVVNCTGIALFKSQSLNAPTSYLWDFGDGQTSTEANPTHTYTATGIYTIKLKTVNNFGVDSLIKPNYVNVTQLTGMVPASCTPASVTGATQFGIARVTFAGIDKQSGSAIEGNMDFTCDGLGQGVIGTQVPITIQNSGTNSERVSVWIDWDNNGVFATNELAYSSNGATIHNGNVTIPANALVNVGLRMRVKSDANNTQTGTACSGLQFGQTEDYQLRLQGNSNPPVALFKADKTISCFSTIQFTDTSLNAPTSWKWYFGDGDSSTLRNPSHTYPGPGQYTVQLIASNANGTNSNTKLNYITISTGDGLKAAPCSPATANTGATNPGAGIIQVILGTINKTSGNAVAESYQDNACSDRTNLLIGQSYTLTVRTNQTINESCRAWIDWNNDGQFADPGERVLTSNNARNHNATINIPATAVIDTSLRLRIVSDIVQGPGGNLQPCNAPNFGQVEDYSVKVIQNTQPPVANLFSRKPITCSGYVQFADSTQNIPTSWFWQFGDGQTSTEQNPLHQYQSTGFFTVKLKATNAFGVDSVERLNYVNVTGIYGPKPAQCTNAVTNNGPFGISRVRLANLDKTSGFTVVDGGYLDYSCGDSAFVVVNSVSQTDVLTVNTSQQQNCRVYIDFNNNGLLETTEQVLNNQNNNVHTANLTFTQSQCLGVPVRMRVISDNRANNINGPCYNPVGGQVEDYMVRLIWAVSVSDQLLEENKISIRPNPSDGQFSMVAPSAFSGQVWTIVDIQGRKISEGRFSAMEVQKIEQQQLTAGLYYLIVESPIGILREKIVVQK